MTHNPNVLFSTITNIRDNAITEWFDIPWLDLVAMMKEQGHKKTINKNVTCISPWCYKTIEEGAEARLNGDGDLWTIDGQPVTARVAENVIGTNMLMFDYDGTLTISEAKQVFADYEYFGYTSFSHMSPSKDGKDCFRIMLPLKQFVLRDDLVARRKSIYAHFQGVDKSCLSLARSFFVPSCDPTRHHLAHMWYNEGKAFDVNDFAVETYTPIHTPVVNPRPVDHDKIIAALKMIYLGNDPEWYNVAVAMASNEFTLEDFTEVTLGGLMHEKDEKACREKWKGAIKSVQRGRVMTIGYIINLLKKHNAWTTLSVKKNEAESILKKIGSVL